ncbi:hypothetical protein [Nocardia sp. R7R-8]|uniref:hypothetical protein n=1 Tax=Nocardia sp. R7R-8 TaxID=3459304 RepID=UPI00403D8954
MKIAMVLRSAGLPIERGGGDAGGRNLHVTQHNRPPPERGVPIGTSPSPNPHAVLCDDATGNEADTVATVSEICRMLVRGPYPVLDIR